MKKEERILRKCRRINGKIQKLKVKVNGLYLDLKAERNKTNG